MQTGEAGHACGQMTAGTPAFFPSAGGWSSELLPVRLAAHSWAVRVGVVAPRGALGSLFNVMRSNLKWQ